MSKIINLSPAVIRIEFSELDGRAVATINRPLPFPLLVLIFCNVLIQWAQQAAIAPGPPVPGSDVPGNTPANVPTKGGA